jgi:biopolymer transport protein ExbB
MDEALEREGASLRTEMERGLEALSIIGAGAPLLGLLGTVTGLMAAFGRIESLGGAVDIAALSGGIWEAMITTATGLGAAIPAIAIGKAFERTVELRLRDMAYAASAMAEALCERGSGDAEDGPAPASRPGALESA